jgi:hypothetical protein
LRPLARMQRLSKDHMQHTIDWSLSRVNITTDIENEKIIPALKLMTRNELMNDLLKLLDLVQKHADKRMSTLPWPTRICFLDTKNKDFWLIGLR